MILSIDDIENNSELNVDLCIIGGGAAGITIAREFIGSKLTVCLVESGNTFLEEEDQALFDTKMVGVIPRISFDNMRLRFFGGTTNHWAGRCSPLVEEVFRNRIDNGLPGWPITFDEFNKFLPQAKEILEIPLEDTFHARPGSVIESDLFEPEEFKMINHKR